MKGNLTSGDPGISAIAVCGAHLAVPINGRPGGTRANWTHTAGADLWPFVTCRDCIAWGMVWWAEEEEEADRDGQPF